MFGERGGSRACPAPASPQTSETSSWLHVSAWGVRRDVDFAPIIWWNQTRCVEYDTLHAWLEDVGDTHLLDGHPGNIIDQLLLGLIVLLQALSLVGIDIGLFQ